MRRRSPSYVDYGTTMYEFNQPASAYDYSYDPQLHGPSFDPYTEIHGGYTQEQTSAHGPPGSRSYHHRTSVHDDNLNNGDTRPPDDKTTHLNVPHSPSVFSGAPPPPLSTQPDPIPTPPTPEYLSTSLTPSTALADPSTSRKLLILDLNGTLLLRGTHIRRQFRPNHRTYGSSYNNPTERRPVRPVYPRPYITSFREYLFHEKTHAWLDTMVWSSAQPHSVADMVNKCFGEQQDELIAVWARDTLGLDSRAYNAKTQTTKDLARPWAALPLPSTADTDSPSISSSRSSSTSPKSPPHPQAEIETTETIPTPSLHQVHSARTTLLLDDSPLKAHLQPWNHVCIPEYAAHTRQQDLEVQKTESRAKLLRKQSNAERNGGFGGTDEPGLVLSVEPGEGFQSSDVGGKCGEDDTHGSGQSKKRKRHKRKGKGKAEHDGDTPYGGLEEVRVGTKEGLLIPLPLTGGQDAHPQLHDGVYVSRAEKYDETLLAVIGILDAIKGQSNVAGWIRGGGLFGGGPVEEMAELTNMSGDGESSGTSDDSYDSDLSVGRVVHERRMRKRKKRWADEVGEDASPGASSVSPVSPTTNTQLETGEEGEVDSGKHARDGEDEGIEIWFENEATMNSWVVRGRRALVELSIPIVSGL